MGYLGYLIFSLPVIILSLICQQRVNSAYKKYSLINNSRRITGAQAAQAVLQHYGVYNVKIVPCAGKLTDNFNPQTNTISLSEGVFNSTSVAAVGIACHEAGHAVQHAENYKPNEIRTALVPVTNFGSRFGLIIAFAGYFIAAGTMLSSIGYYIIIAGLALYGLTALFQLVTLPVEFNASSRALSVIEETGLLAGDEYKAAKSVLSAAAMTYVAALATSVVNLLYYVLRLLGTSGRRRR